MKELATIVVFLAMVAVFVALLLWVASIKCRVTGDEMKLDSHFRIIGGCFVRVDERYVPLGTVRIVDGKVTVGD